MIGPLPYIGGKRRLAPTIAALLPPHTTYVEPFAGGAQVFFHKPRSHIEVLNDLDEQVLSFFRVCQHHHEELSRWMRWATASRRLFELFSQQPVESLTDIQRAARFLYLQKNSFGGRRHRQNFAYAVGSKPRYTPDRLPDLLAKTAARLEATLLECLPYEEVLQRYDSPTTFFYCDPPYFGIKLYRHNLQHDDFRLLAQRLGTLRGRFILSINDTGPTRKLFAHFHRREVGVTYGSSLAFPRHTELLYSNYPLGSP